MGRAMHSAGVRGPRMLGAQHRNLGEGYWHLAAVFRLTGMLFTISADIISRMFSGASDSVYLV